MVINVFELGMIIMVCETDDDCYCYVDYTIVYAMVLM